MMVLTLINKSPVEIKGAGRTDRGVHAENQKATFSLNINIPEERLQTALNSLLKPYIYITDVKVVDENFHARFNVYQKEYVYKINIGEFNPFLEDYTYQASSKLDIRLMKKCSKLFIGIHNFKNFVAGSRQNYECIIYNISFKEKNNILEIKFTGKSFYRYMVRNLVGAMLEIGTKKRGINEVEKALLSSEIPKQFTTAVSKGLYLTKITYENIKK